MVSLSLFVIAGLIAGIGILVVYKRLVYRLANLINENKFNQQSLQKEQTKYFISVALIEALPIILFVFGFVNAQDAAIDFSSKIIPFIIILGLAAFCIAQVFITKQEIPTEKLSSSEQNLIKTFHFVGIATILAIPTLSIVGILVV
ncbi:hypothetical protein ACFOZ1_10065 [Gracilibacillus marinus]|uniref:V-ATPase proteolipid subunit C-like domain-containing protein n=1 Tax=Gracilibacillus marinus TaxID=630535 RepID=A0ABV8VZC3_9BACI